MDQKVFANPFHVGEVKAQQKAGVGNVAEWAGGFIRKFLPQQHREFFSTLPFIIASGEDADGKIWITLLEGKQGFISSPDPQSLLLETKIDQQDPLAEAFENKTEVGVVGIELATRRRNRFSGQIEKTDNGYRINIKQSFGNCPQYITERGLERMDQTIPMPAIAGTQLSNSQAELIAGADTLFIGTGQKSGKDQLSNGFDASHRGGRKGFVQIVDDWTLLIPDYSGNNFFNTIGNLTLDKRVGLVFIEFHTGTLLHVSGTASVDWSSDAIDDPNARRAIRVKIDKIIERQEATSLKWNTLGNSVRRLSVIKKHTESREITSFYLGTADGGALPEFRAGQHLPIEVQIPGKNGTIKRSYSLSGNPENNNEYRLSIKRESHGLVSRFLHDQVDEGSYIHASLPSGAFVIPDDNTPLVLISAGVGVTPMISMLHEAFSNNNDRVVWFVHGARNSHTHALAEEVDKLISKYPNANKQIFYSQPTQEDIQNQSFDQVGRITAKSVLALNQNSNAYYMQCGPGPFLSQLKTELEHGGISSDRILFETFGPSGN
ncbi:MAG: pyridoxamine 5'-phosphate oxidase family protein [Lentilitoribacter sp.]